MPCELLVTESSCRTGTLLLPAGCADGVRFGLQGHAEFGSETGDGSRWEVKVEPLQQSGEKEEHLHAGELLPQALTSPCKGEDRPFALNLEHFFSILIGRTCSSWCQIEGASRQKKHYYYYFLDDMARTLVVRVKEHILWCRVHDMQVFAV